MAGLSFQEKLDARIASANTLLCVGLDPNPANMPSGMDTSPRSVALFCREIVEATQDQAAAFKPNIAFFLALGSKGIMALEAVMEVIPDDIPVILDAKVNDLGDTAKAYARAAFDEIQADALTVAPYLGEDALQPYLSQRGKGIIMLVKTSNKGSGDVQDLELASGEPLYLHLADKCREWDERYPSNVGMVVGATHPAQLEEVRRRCPDQTILLPGLGAQGGDVRASVRAGVNARGTGLLCSASRSIMYAGSSGDYATLAHAVAVSLRNEINRYRAATA